MELTFCRALLLTRLAFGTIFTAYSLFVSKEVALYTLANPPFPNSFPRKYLCTVYPSPFGLFLCSIIVTDSLSEDEAVFFSVGLDTGALCPVSAHVLKLELETARRNPSVDMLLIALLFSLLDSTDEYDGFRSKARESFFRKEGGKDEPLVDGLASVLMFLWPKGRLGITRDIGKDRQRWI